MSTTAPPRPDTFSGEDAELLRRLDPDNERPCAATGCEAIAAYRWSCVSCGGGGALCAPHTARGIVYFNIDAAAHVGASCANCGLKFCSHDWPRFIQILPLEARS